jgi:hypothetical protein
MCTVIPLRKMNKPSIAKEDIVVYKAGLDSLEGNQFVSPFQSFKYELGKTYNVNFDYNNSDVAFDNKETKYKWKLTNSYAMVRSGFHALTTLDKKRFNKGSRVYATFGKFIIPKGSNYFKNSAGCIVSETIIFKEFIE